DWAIAPWARSDPVAQRLLAVARAADPDPWRDQVRAALQGRDRKVLETLSGSKEIDGLPPHTLTLLAVALREVGAQELALAVLQRGHHRYPDDFWVNFYLGVQLDHFVRPRQAREAIQYYMAALALRPRTPGVHNNLGVALAHA